MTDNILSSELRAWHRRGIYRKLQSDHNVFTIDSGEDDRPVIILIHGFPTSSWDFEPVWTSLNAKFRLVTLDMLGFGFSDKPNKRNYSILKQADLFERLIETLGVTDYHIFAHDYGVSVAQELLARQHVGAGVGACLSCCFLNGGLFPETHHALLVQKLLLSPLGQIIYRLLGYKAFCKSFSHVFGEETKPSQQELENFWSIICFNNGRHLFYNLMTYILDRKTHRDRWLKAMQGSTIPLAVINGSVDPVSGAHLVTRYKELECRLDYLKEFSTLGHYPHTENPDAIAASYLEFVNKV